MKCGVKYFIVSLVLLSLFSALSWAEVTLSEAEWLELNQIMTELDKQLIAQAMELRTLKSILRAVKISLIDSQVATDEARRLSQEAEQSYKQQRRVTWVAGIVSGLSAGLIGFIAGFIAR